MIRSTVHPTFTAAIVVEQFLEAISEFDSPQSTLTDNGLVFTTSRTRGGQNAFEYPLEELGIEQKNSRAHHPQTQGKIERFHQTLKKWLSARPRAANITELQALIDQFRELYNNSRPCKALKGKTPAVAYQARPKAKPESDPIPGNKKRRNDRVDKEGKVSLRRAGRMHHIGVGRAHTGKRVHLVFTSKKVMIVDQRTAEILGENLIEPTRSCWPKIQTPGHESL